MPLAWWLSILCEEFGCVPSVAYREWLTVPTEMLEEIIEARAYVRAKQDYDSATDKTKLPKTRMGELVKTIEFEIVQGLIKKQNPDE